MIKNIFFVCILGFGAMESSLMNSASAKTDVAILPKVQNVVATSNSIQLSANNKKEVTNAVLHPTANKSYKVKGVTYYPTREATEFTQTGSASWYGKGFQGRKTASGERFNMYEMTAAHKTLPIPSYAKVTNLANGKEIVVKINDRGPFHGNRVMDLSYGAAKGLGFVNSGTAQVKIERVFPRQEKKGNTQEETSPTYITIKKFENIAQAQSFVEQISNKAILDKLQIIQEKGGYIVRLQLPEKSDKAEQIKQTLLISS